MPEIKQDKKNRRRDLVQIAYRHIAERGFEGLRIHDVALEAGINNATLHYYFQTKEALIQGVVEALIEEFARERGPQPRTLAANALEELRIEFEDVRRRFRENPEQMQVATELLVRSLRDSAIAPIFGQLDSGWRGYLESMIARGIQQGIFRPDLDQEVSATVIMVLIKGFGYQFMNRTNLDIADDVLTMIQKQVEAMLKTQD